MLTLVTAHKQINWLQASLHTAAIRPRLLRRPSADPPPLPTFAQSETFIFHKVPPVLFPPALLARRLDNLQPSVTMTYFWNDDETQLVWKVFFHCSCSCTSCRRPAGQVFESFFSLWDFFPFSLPKLPKAPPTHFCSKCDRYAVSGFCCFQSNTRVTLFFFLMWQQEMKNNYLNNSVNIALFVCTHFVFYWVLYFKRKPVAETCLSLVLSPCFSSCIVGDAAISVVLFLPMEGNISIKIINLRLSVLYIWASHRRGDFHTIFPESMFGGGGGGFNVQM